MSGIDEDDVDFDFKSMLSNLDDPDALADIFSPQLHTGFPSGAVPTAGTIAGGGAPLHPMQSRQQALSMGEMLDSRLFRPDAPWSMGSGRQGLTAAPPPANFNPGPRSNRSNSGAIISTRLRAASDMFQQGFLTSEEKALMKDLILTKHPKFKEEYANAERTGNWYSLQQFLRGFNRMNSPANSMSMVIDNLTQDFQALATPPPPLPASAQQQGETTKSVRKRMASQTTPVARPKKTTSATKREAAAAGATTTSVVSTPTASEGVPEKPSSTRKAAMDLKELEIEAAIAAADGDSEQVAKLRKNERERRRRLAVSNGFDELFELLKLPQAAQIDKVSILRRAIDRIKELEQRVGELEQQLAS